MRLLIANRGEIARRVQRTARRLGVSTVAVYADPDREAPFVREADAAFHLGGAALADSYLNVERLLTAARDTGATAVHPGYGFLSENADFARAVQDAGLVWVGPRPEAIERMGSKIEARRLAEAAGVPTIPGFDRDQAPEALARAADQIGFPVLVKAAAGGGGKGIRIVRAAGEFEAALGEATEEARRSFGDDAMIVERYIERARHIEVQIVGDHHGNVVHLGTRECSVQRRYQKLLEEAPAPNLTDATVQGLCSSALALAKAIDYDSTGTVEYVVDDATGEFFFLEMNTRLQVEHPVTEAITGLDLVEWQLAVAEGRALPLPQEAIAFRGHAFEARINAENAAADFAPETGQVAALVVPEGVRWESGVEEGSAITPHYDALVAKLVIDGVDREAARRRLVAALDALIIGGLVTNTGFQRWLAEQQPVVEGRVTTRFLDETEVPAPSQAAAAVVSAAHGWERARRAQAEPGPWSLPSLRVTPHRPSLPTALLDETGEWHEVADTDATDFSSRDAVVVDAPGRRVWVNRAGHSYAFRLPPRRERWAPNDAESHGAADAVRAPFPAVVAETPVAAGATVAPGDVVVVVEAMKMLHSLESRAGGVVAQIHVGVGDSVESEQVLVSFVQEEDASDADA
ncbi:MAG: biotin carboxylase N-terminal domain-containing protein [Myxococcota bacterium]